MAQTSIAQTIQKLSISQSDKRLLLATFNGLADDLEQMRNALNGALAKLDAGGATVAALGTTNVATLAVAKTSLNVKKS